MTTNPGAGHVGPLVPFVNAFLDAGDAVLVAAPASARATVEAAGLPFHPLGDPPQEQLDAVFGSLPGLSHDEQGVRVMREVFAGMRARASLPAVLRLVTDFRPDLLLRETTEYAGLLAAERLGVRHGRIGIMAGAMETWAMPVVAPVLDAHRARLGLRPDPSSTRIARSPYLTVIPEAMEDADDLGPAHALRFREPAPAPRQLPDWWTGDERPLGERVAALCAGIAVPEEPDAIAGIGDAVRRLLDEPSFRSAARRVAAEVAALPAVDDAPHALRESLGDVERVA